MKKIGQTLSGKPRYRLENSDVEDGAVIELPGKTLERKAQDMTAGTQLGFGFTVGMVIGIGLGAVLNQAGYIKLPIQEQVREERLDPGNPDNLRQGVYGSLRTNKHGLHNVDTIQPRQNQSQQRNRNF